MKDRQGGSTATFRDLDAEWARRTEQEDRDLAAQVAGHDPSTETGRSDARADHRYWDLLDGAA